MIERSTGHVAVHRIELSAPCGSFRAAALLAQFGRLPLVGTLWAVPFSYQ